MGPSPATWAPHLPRPSPPPPRLEPRAGGLRTNSASREAPQGRSRQGAPSLGRIRHLRLARGYPGKASAGVHSPYRARRLAQGLGKEPDLRLARGLILHVARGRLVRGPSPPASADPPNNSSCLINASTTPAISAGRWLNATGWPTRPEVASAPYRPGQATVSYHCVLPLCPRPAPYRLGKGTTGITDHCVQTLCP